MVNNMNEPRLANLPAPLNVHTLKTRKDFLRVRNHNQKYVQPGMIIQAAPGCPSKTGQGITVTKKVDKRAVVRNRIKRRLRALIADIFPGHAKAGWDYVVIGRKETLTRPYQDLQKDMRRCLKKLA